MSSWLLDWSVWLILRGTTPSRLSGFVEVLASDLLWLLVRLIILHFGWEVSDLNPAGDFALTAVSIAEQVGIITNPVHAVKHFSDLPYDTPMDQIPPFDDNKEKGDPVTSLVLSGSEMTTMTESQWKQVMTVRPQILLLLDFILTYRTVR
jgi:hypothetical protein